ncbi:MAG: DUF2905 family protein [Bacteroidia bacterium]|nr:DUF2905 family protein [Bacteroidia bacterium]MDW8236144.1 DUF2905 family protein [Bacteroidia bacterium]
MARWLMVLGASLLLLGALLWWLEKAPFRIPGDIVIEKENFRLYLPLGTSLLLSLLLSGLWYLWQRLRG